jgi:hypothetical protein
MCIHKIRIKYLKICNLLFWHSFWTSVWHLLVLKLISTSYVCIPATSASLLGRIKWALVVAQTAVPPPYEVLSESSSVVIVLTASVKDERGGQNHTSESLLHQSATWHPTMNMHYFYMSVISTLYRFVLYVWQTWAMCLQRVLYEAW